MNIAIVLTHNKADNEAQIATLKSLLTKVTVPLFNTTYTDKGEEVQTPILDEQGVQKQGFTHYTLDLPFPHKVSVYQIVPFGVDRPTGYKDLVSHNVLYGVGDEDKTGDHPRFFNWGLKRGTDYGADITVHIEDMAKFSVEDLAIQLNTIIDPNTKEEYLDDESVKLASVTLLKETGQLDETKSKEEAIEELKDKLEVKGG